mmetsp:Transcript_18930/g.37680  ORF Transcript_18930/g.37680 Transcript_18930/m.37680 type:complete len:153 (-) Transcript_18930:100-558(-)
MNIGQFGREDKRTRIDYKDRQKREAFSKMGHVGDALSLHEAVVQWARELFSGRGHVGICCSVYFFFRVVVVVVVGTQLASCSILLSLGRRFPRRRVIDAALAADSSRPTPGWTADVARQPRIHDGGGTGGACRFEMVVCPCTLSLPQCVVKT